MLLLLVGGALAGLPETNPYTLTCSARAITEYEQGYVDGRQDAEGRSVLRPAVLGGAAGLVIAGTATFSCGICGSPLAVAGCIVPPVAASSNPPIPEPGPWEQREEQYRAGYLYGYQETGKRRTTRAALLGGMAGSATGVVGAYALIKGIQILFFPDTDLPL